MAEKLVAGNSLAWRIRQKVVYVARKNLGYGETEGNNRGQFIRAIGGIDGREWCATFAGYCYERAYEMLREEMPFARSAGAKRLTKNLGAVKRARIWKPDAGVTRPCIGDLVCWSRGLLGWTGHVGIVVELTADGFRSIEGNRGNNGTVGIFTHHYTDPKLWRFAGLR